MHFSKTFKKMHRNSHYLANATGFLFSRLQNRSLFHAVLLLHCVLGIVLCRFSPTIILSHKQAFVSCRSSLALGFCFISLFSFMGFVSLPFSPLYHLWYQFILSVNFISAFYQCIISVHFINAFHQCILLVHFISTYYWFILSIHSISAF